MFKKIVLIICSLPFAVSVFAQSSTQKVFVEPPTANEILKWHEVFTYEVRYSFFKLGEVKVEIVADTVFEKQKGYYLKTVITSSGIPFVGDERNRYGSIFAVEDSAFKALTFWTDNVDEKIMNESRYTFDYEKGKVYGYLKENNKRDTLRLERPATAGHLLFLLSRLRAGIDTTVTVPVYINLKKKKAVITHTSKRVKREYDAFNHPIMTYYTQGHVDFDGPFGFSGDFEAWFTTGERRIPVEARVDVWLGHVKLKLINYKKEPRK